MHKFNDKKILAIGLGGGFDIFTVLPLVYANPNTQFVLVNQGSSYDFLYQEAIPPSSESYIEKTFYGNVSGFVNFNIFLYL